MAKPVISVIIPAYNASVTLQRTLMAVFNQEISLAYEVIVVDDGSTDDTERIVKDFPQVVYLKQLNAGPASARNHGARFAQGDFLAFTDSDCFPHRDWLARLLEGFRSPDIAVVCGSYGIANPYSRLARCVHREILFRHQHLMTSYPKAFGGYNFCARKKIFQQVGGFNERYRRASGEDNDLSYRFLKAGFKIYFNSLSLVDHVHPISVRRYLSEQYRHGFWRVMMYADYVHMARGDGYTFWKDVIEMPWVLAGVGGVVTAASGLGFNLAGIFLIMALLVFEMTSAVFMQGVCVDGIFFGWVTFLRAFARFAGFSTGFFCFIKNKIEKKFK